MTPLLCEVWCAAMRSSRSSTTTRAPAGAAAARAPSRGRRSRPPRRPHRRPPGRASIAQSRIAGNSTTSRIERLPVMSIVSRSIPRPDATGRRHSVLQRLDEHLVVRLGLVFALGRKALLRLEAAALLIGVVQLRERVRDLHPRDESLEPLDEALLAAVVLGERRELLRVVDDEHRIGDDGSTCLLSRSSTSAGQLRSSVASSIGEASIAATSDSRSRCCQHVDAGALEDRVAQRHAAPRRREVDVAGVPAGARRRG